LGGDLLRFATAGSVDDGKSTLIGRLLFDSKAILEDQLAHVREVSERRGDGHVDLSLLTDGLRAEREQGITIDVAYRYFATPRRSFIIADTPGHEDYTRNMVTGASTADLALILVDARNGVVRQSRRHSFIASLLGIRHLVVCVNKMDLVDFAGDAFDGVVAEFTAFAAKLEVSDVTFIPISALHGDNVVERSERMPWFEGPPLLYHLEHVHIASDRNLIDARFPVQYVIRPMDEQQRDYRGYAGQLASGVLRVGDEVVVLPSGRRSRIAGIDTLDSSLHEAFAPQSVVLRLEDDLDVSRGDLICRPHNRPEVTQQVEATVCWLSERPLTREGRYVLKHTTRSVRASVQDVRYRIEVETMHRDEDSVELALNDIGRVHLSTSMPLLLDPYRENRVTGAFVLIDEATNDTVGAGMVTAARALETGADSSTRSPNVVWQAGAVSRDRRWASLGQRGVTVWFTGLPAAGKSTLAAAVEQHLVEHGFSAYRLDGDNLRHGLTGDLGFDPPARAENVRRTAHAARLFADAGVIALVSLISPYREDRDFARQVHEDDGLAFLEVFVDTPLRECERRDPKGLYERARRGEIEGFTGVDDPYEPPDRPELRVRTVDQSIEDACRRILSALRGLDIIPSS